MKAMSAVQRVGVILDLVRDGQECSVVELARQFGVSEMTVRRDLDALSAEGRVVRTHGGATAASGVVFEFRFLEKEREHKSAKHKIAAAAAKLVDDGMTVMLDSGTTTLALAHALREKRDLTVVTTSLPIASALQYSDVIDVVLLGGRLRRDAPDLSGALPLRALEGLHAHMAFIGADAVDLKGNTYNDSIEVAHLIQAITTVAEVVYCVADASKIGNTSLARSGSLDQWKGLITDSSLSTGASTKLRKRGVKIIRAK